MLADQNEDMWNAVEALFNRRYGYRGAISDQGPTFAASPTCDVHRCAQCAAQTSPCGEILGRWGDTGARQGGQFMPLQPMGGGAAPPTALMSSPQKAAREGKKVTKGRQSGRKGQGRPSTGPRRWKSVDICINQELTSKPSTTIQRMLVDVADVPLHLIPMIYLEINASW